MRACLYTGKEEQAPQIRAARLPAIHPSRVYRLSRVHTARMYIIPCLGAIAVSIPSPLETPAQ